MTEEQKNENSEQETSEQKEMSEALRKIGQEPEQDVSKEQKKSVGWKSLEKLSDKPTEEEINRFIPQVVEELKNILDNVGYETGRIRDEDTKFIKRIDTTLLFIAQEGGMSKEQLEMTRLSKSDKKNLAVIIDMAERRLIEEARAEIYAEILKRNGLL